MDLAVTDHIDRPSVGVAAAGLHPSHVGSPGDKTRLRGEWKGYTAGCGQEGTQHRRRVFAEGGPANGDEENKEGTRRW